MLTNQNRKFQDSYNESIAKTEQFERELITQKEILRQFEVSKTEIVNKLRRELDTVEERFLIVINDNNMVGEDIRSRAYLNLMKYEAQLATSIDLQDQLAETITELNGCKQLISSLELEREQTNMLLNDQYSKFWVTDQTLI